MRRVHQTPDLALYTSGDYSGENLEAVLRSWTLIPGQTQVLCYWVPSVIKYYFTWYVMWKMLILHTGYLLFSLLIYVVSYSIQCTLIILPTLQPDKILVICKSGNRWREYLPLTRVILEKVTLQKCGDEWVRVIIKGHYKEDALCIFYFW